MKIYIASDHAGFNLKQEICTKLKAQQYNVNDLGAHNQDSTDYPTFAHDLCHKLYQDQKSFGILICGTGIGMSITANRSLHIRAALCNSIEYATLARQHNDANVICLGARFISIDTAMQCITAFLNTPFEGGRHQARINMMTSTSQENTI